MPADLNRVADIETQIDVAVVVLLNMVLGPHPLERRTQHLPDDDLSIGEQIVTAKQRHIASEEVDIHLGDDFPEPVRPDPGADSGIDGVLDVFGFKE